MLIFRRRHSFYSLNRYESLLIQSRYMADCFSSSGLMKLKQADDSDGECVDSDLMGKVFDAWK